jgi:hypothetical protein
MNNSVIRRLPWAMLAIALVTAPALAQLAATDVSGQTRTTPQATMGALEAPSAKPDMPRGLALKKKSVTL